MSSRETIPVFLSIISLISGSSEAMCPPNADQTTRTTCRWHFIVPRLCERQIIAMETELIPPRIWSLQPLNVLFRAYHWNAWAKLAKPGPRGPTLAIDNRQRKVQQDSPLISLPLELLDQICNFLVADNDMASLISLALSCSHVFGWVQPHIEASQRVVCAPWAGMELACLGTYLTSLPGPFERDNLLFDSVPYKGGPTMMCMARRMNWAAWSQYKTVENQRLVNLDVEEALSSLSAANTGIPPSTLNDLKTRLSGQSLFPPNQPFVLRNIDTQEFIRCVPGNDTRGYVVDPDSGTTSIADDDDNNIGTRASKRAKNAGRKGTEQQDQRRFCIDDLLLLRICWTRPTEFPGDWSPPLAQGKWAGCRFEIVSEQGATTNQGTDVTAEIVEEARWYRAGLEDGVWKGREG